MSDSQFYLLLFGVLSYASSKYWLPKRTLFRGLVSLNAVIAASTITFYFSEKMPETYISKFF